MIRAEVPTGTPPQCHDPDGEIDIFDVMVIINLALDSQDCCSYYYKGVIYWKSKTQEVRGLRVKVIFTYDGDVDAEDVTKFLEDFGRSQYNNPCPQCVAGDWCVYP